MLNYQAKLQTQVGLKFLREVLIRQYQSSSGILSVQKRHQGLKNKRWDFQRSYKSLKTAVILRQSLTNFFAVLGKLATHSGWPPKVPKRLNFRFSPDEWVYPFRMKWVGGGALSIFLENLFENLFDYS